MSKTGDARTTNLQAGDLRRNPDTDILERWNGQYWERIEDGSINEPSKKNKNSGTKQPLKQDVKPVPTKTKQREMLAVETEKTNDDNPFQDGMGKKPEGLLYPVMGVIVIVLIVAGLIAGGVFVVNIVSDHFSSEPPIDYGTLQVISTPLGLGVELDDEFIGTTPMYLRGIKEGYYRISLVDGVPQIIEIVAGEVTHVSLDGTSSENTGGSMTVMVSPAISSWVYLDGEYQGKTTSLLPLTMVNIQEGNHMIRIRSDGYEDLEYPFTSDGTSKQSISLVLSKR